MKFQLFGKLRGDDEGSDDSGGQEVGFGPSTQQQKDDTQFGPENMNPGDSLDRTVGTMMEQGYSQDEIMQELRGEYREQEIQNAMNNAVANNASRSGGGGPEPMTPYRGDSEEPDVTGERIENEGSQKGPVNQQPQQNQIQGGNPPPQQPVGGQQASPEVEELIETVVAEKMDEVLAEFDQVYSEIDEIADAIEDLEDRVHDLEVREDEDQSEFIQKVDEMEEHVDEYQSRIGGLEKAFQQVLPSLVENVRDLTGLVQEIKKERGISTEKTVTEEDIEDLDVEDW